MPFSDNGVRFPEDRLPLINRTHDLGGGRKPRKAVDGKGGYHAAIDVFHQLHCLVGHSQVSNIQSLKREAHFFHRTLSANTHGLTTIGPTRVSFQHHSLSKTVKLAFECTLTTALRLCDLRSCAMVIPRLCSLLMIQSHRLAWARILVATTSAAISKFLESGRRGIRFSPQYRILMSRKCEIKGW